MDFIGLLTWHTIPLWLGVVLWFVVHRITIFCYTAYWHSYASHRHITIAPWLQHAMRFWQWIHTRLWYHGHLVRFTAEHRIHHRYQDTDKDANNAARYSLWQLWHYDQSPGSARYVSWEDVEKYGDPSIEPTDRATMFYKKHQCRGWLIAAVVWAYLLGPLGIAFAYLYPIGYQYWSTFKGDWLWHKFGYRHPKSTDTSRNIFPWPITDGLHSNHHADPGAVNKRVRWFEIDLLYWQYRFLSLLGWVKITHRSQTF